MPEMLKLQDGDSLERVVEVLCFEGVGIVPTDTIYGLVVVGSQPKARSKLLALKPRSPKFPYGFLISDPLDVQYLGLEVSPLAESLMQKHWPGNLTLVLKRSQSSFDDHLDAATKLANKKKTLSATDLAAGDPSFGIFSVGVRCPDHIWLRSLIKATGPLAATSVNAHKQPPATSIQNFPSELLSQVDIVVDAGELPGTPSTVVDVTSEDIETLRKGELEINAQDL